MSVNSRVDCTVPVRTSSRQRRRRVPPSMSQSRWGLRSPGTVGTPGSVQTGMCRRSDSVRKLQVASVSSTCASTSIRAICHLQRGAVSYSAEYSPTGAGWERKTLFPAHYGSSIADPLLIPALRRGLTGGSTRLTAPLRRGSSKGSKGLILLRSGRERE